MNKIWRFILSQMIAHFSGVIGSIFTTASINTWYAGLNKPEWTPPDSIFGPVWLILYTTIGVALFLLWENKDREHIKWLWVFFIANLFINSLWSIVFFGAQSTLYGLIDILVLWAMVVLLVYKTQKVDKRISFLLMPYMYWVTYAAALNYTIWLSN